MTIEATGTETCPQCHGTPEHTVVMCGAKSAGSEEMACRITTSSCDVCGGLGIVEFAVADRYRRGEDLRRKRVKKFRLTVMQLASILRISPILPNDFEWGRADLPPHVAKRLVNYERG